MKENNLEVIFETRNPAEADMIAEVLKSEGIDCLLLDRNASGQIAGFGPAIRIRLAVSPREKEKAFEILKRIH